MIRENVMRQAGIEYFKKNKSFQRFFDALRQKWKKYGRPAGVILLKDATGAEREALGRFSGKTYFAGDIRITVAEFEKALQETKFSDLTIQELLEGYYGEKLEKNTSVRQRQQDRRLAYYESLLKDAGPDVAAWLQCAWHEHRYGYVLMKSLYETAPEELRRIISALSALAALRQDDRRLAVISARISGNPHYFDVNQPAGKLLICFLSCQSQAEEPKSAEGRLELYYKNGLRPDDMSSFTFLYGIHLYGPRGLHPAYEGFISCQEPYTVTLSNLKNIQKADSYAKRVYVVENQTVFSDLCACALDKNIAIMCTSGQVRTASLIVLDLLVAQNCQIFYSGDLDPEGILIADRLVTRHPDHIRPWHMAPADYNLAISQEPITTARLKQLANIKNENLRALIPLLQAKKKAGYQELLLERLKYDIES